MVDDLIMSYLDVIPGGEDIPVEGKQLVPRNIEMNALLEGFEKRLNRDNGNKTRSTKGYVDTAREFLNHGNIKGKSEKEWTIEDVNAVYDDWASEIIHPKNQTKTGVRDPNTMTMRIWAMNRFFVYIGRSDLKQKPGKIVRREVIPLTDAEMISVLEAARTMSKYPILCARDYAIVAGLMETAARNGEMADLKKADVDSDRKVIILRDTKGGGDQYLPLTPEVESAILEYLRLRPTGATPEDEEYLFLTKGRKKMEPADIWQMVRIAGFKAGLNRPIKPHLLRHSKLSQLARTMTLPDLQTISRHKNIETLMIYVHANSEEVAKQVRNLSLFNRVKVIDLRGTGIQTPLLNVNANDDIKRLAHLLANGSIDQETYKSALTALSTGLNVAESDKGII